MRLRRRAKIGITLGVLMGIVVVVCLLVPSSPPEPFYNGKTLTQWLEQYHQSFWTRFGLTTGGSLKESRQAYDAISRIGSNGVPTLVKLIATRDSSLKRFLTNHISQATANRLHFSNYWHGYCRASFERPELGHEGFSVLGSNGSVGLPALVRVIQTSDNSSGRIAAAGALAGIGPDARAVLPELVNCLRDRDPNVQVSAKNAINSIINASGPSVRHQAIDLVLPPLVGIVADRKTDPFLAIETLGELGPDARSVVLVLLPLIHSTNISRWYLAISPSVPPSDDFMIGPAARRALQKIDPAAIK